MNVSGIRPYSGFYNVNVVPPTRQEVEQLEEKAVERQKDGASLSISREAMDVASTSAREKQTFGSYDYAKQYRPDADAVKNIGSAADIKSLDVQKAVSDMQKDEALQQYQVFVEPVAGTDAAAAARGVENFTL